VDALAAFAAERLGSVDFWINNAGQVTSKRLLADVPVQEILEAVNANVLGSLLGSRAAIQLMRGQPSGGHVFNLGFSKWGANFSKTAVTHKMTKRSLSQLTQSLSEELAAAGEASALQLSRKWSTVPPMREMGSC
jgi:chlorophyll(ide) b reductase